MKEKTKNILKQTAIVTQYSILIAAFMAINVYWYKLASSINKVPAQGWIITAIAALTIIALYAIASIIVNLIKNIKLSKLKDENIEEYYKKQSGFETQEEYRKNLLDVEITFTVNNINNNAKSITDIVTKNNYTIKQFKNNGIDISQFQAYLQSNKIIPNNEFFDKYHKAISNKEKSSCKTKIVCWLLCVAAHTIFITLNILFLTKTINNAQLILTNKCFVGIFAVLIVAALILTLIAIAIFISEIIIYKKISNEIEEKLPLYAQCLCTTLEIKMDIDKLTTEEINTQYLKLSKQYHSDTQDISGSDEDKKIAEEKFKKITKANIELNKYLTIKDAGFFEKLAFIKDANHIDENGNQVDIETTNSYRIDNILGRDNFIKKLLVLFEILIDIKKSAIKFFDVSPLTELSSGNVNNIESQPGI